MCDCDQFRNPVDRGYFKTISRRGDRGTCVSEWYIKHPRKSLSNNTPSSSSSSPFSFKYLKLPTSQAIYFCFDIKGNTMTGIKASKHIAVFLFPFWGVFFAVITICICLLICFICMRKAHKTNVCLIGEARTCWARICYHFRRRNDACQNYQRDR